MSSTPAAEREHVHDDDASLWEADEKRRQLECAAEPIRTLGRVQSHGILFALDPRTGVVVTVSDNAAHWLGRELREAGDANLGRAVDEGVALDPVRVDFEGRSYDAIVHRDSDPLLVELEPVTGSLDYIRTGVVSAIQRLGPLIDADELRVAAAQEIKAITGFDRVVCYHFHADGHGQVVADEREPDMEPLLGLHFPASDIPSQARALYVEKRSRVILDTEDDGVPLQTLIPDAPTLDLTRTELRAVSPHHVQFMRNMGQASTLSLAMVIDDRLIGMFTCAHRSVHPLPVLLRRALEVLVNQVATQLKSAWMIEDLRRQLGARERRAAIVAPLYGPSDTGEVLFEREQTVLDVIPADGAYLRVGDTVRSIGAVSAPEELGAVIDVLGRGPFVTDGLSVDHPDLAARVPDVAGLLIVPLVSGGCLAFVRKEVVLEVEWLGDQRPANRDDPFSPRRSFSAWRQSVTGRSAPWNRHAQDAFEMGEEIRSALAGRDQAELAELALRDALTGLHNRRYLTDRLDVLLRESRRVAAVFLDIDDFKSVNDTHGHQVGDTVLVELSRRLTATSRVGDVVVRLGGDEFVVICPDVDDADAHRIAQRALTAISDPIIAGSISLVVTASAGVVAAGEVRTATGLLRDADSAMYRAKRAGRGRVSG